jgi:hypothetical protein
VAKRGNELLLQQTLEGELAAARTKYQGALTDADGDHALRVQTARTGYEALLQQARDTMETSLAGFYDEFNLNIGAYETAREAALDIARTRFGVVPLGRSGSCVLRSPCLLCLGVFHNSATS